MNFIDELLQEAELAEENRRIEMNNLRADQLLMGIQKLEGQIDEVDHLADEEIQLIQEYRKSETERLGKKVRWLAWNLEQFIRSSDLKTIRLPHGILKLRTGKDKLEVTDFQSFISIPENQKFLRVIPESYQPNIMALHEHLKQTGHIPEGIDVVPGEVKFTYSTSGKDNNNGKADQQQPSEA